MGHWYQLVTYNTLLLQFLLNPAQKIHTTGERDILSLKVWCDNSSNGCEWIGELRSLDKHLASCEFTLLPCPNKCAKDGMVIQLLRKDLNKHINEECPRQ